MLQHVLTHLLALEVVLLDVLALASREALVERNEDDAAQHGVRLVAELGRVVQALNHEPAERVADRVAVLDVDVQSVARDDCFQVGRTLQILAYVVLVRDDGARLQKRRQHELAAEGIKREGAAVALPDNAADKLAQRTLAVVPLRAVEERRLVPCRVRANRRTDNLPQQLRGFGLVGKLLKPRVEVPVGAVLVVVDEHVLGVLVVIRANLRREDPLWVESQEHLGLVVEHPVVQSDKVAVVAAELHGSHRAQESLRLVHVALHDGRAGVADDALDGVVVRRVDALVVPAVVVHGKGAHVGGVGIARAVVHANHVVLEHDDRRQHVRVGGGEHLDVLLDDNLRQLCELAGVAFRLLLLGLECIAAILQLLVDLRDFSVHHTRQVCRERVKRHGEVGVLVSAGVLDVLLRCPLYHRVRCVNHLHHLVISHCLLPPFVFEKQKSGEPES